MAHRVRAMVAGDLPAAVDIEQQSSPSPWSHAHFASALAAGDLALVVEAPDGTVIAFLIAAKVLDECHLHGIAVHPAWRQCGIARTLLSAMEQQSMARGATSILLEVRAGNRPARALYEASGYAVVGHRKGYYPGPDGREDAVLYTRHL